MNSDNWVYLVDERVVGYIIGCIICDEFHLNNIAVHPKYLRRSIGKALIKHIIKRIRYRDVQSILLEVCAHNISAQKCYQSIGFVQVGKRKDYYSIGSDAILYNLDLRKDG